MHPEILNKLISLALLAAGIVLIVYGVDASDSLGSGVFTGSLTNRTLWLLIGGVAASVVGTAGLFRGAKIP